MRRNEFSGQNSQKWAQKSLFTAEKCSTAIFVPFFGQKYFRIAAQKLHFSAFRASLNHFRALTQFRKFGQLTN